LLENTAKRRIDNAFTRIRAGSDKHNRS